MSNNPPQTAQTIGLSMIVKNGGDDLRHCLKSVTGLVSQIVLLDTGSTDNTAAVAGEFGATLIAHPWTGNFADARNTALDRMRTDWILVLDADEELSPEALTAIPKLLEHTPQIGGYYLTIRNYLPKSDVQFRNATSVPNQDTHRRATHAPSWAEHDLCRLFRRDPRIRYAGRVHEMVEHSIAAAGLRLEHAGCRILHFGQLAPAPVHAQKALFYREPRPRQTRRRTKQRPGLV